MEICITRFFSAGHLPLRNLSGSIAELGPLAGATTYRNSCALGGGLQLLDTPEKLQAFMDFVESSGFEPSGNEDLQGLFIQWIAGDLREMDCETIDDLRDPAVLRDQQAGVIPSNIFVGQDGEVYFDVS